MALTARNGVGVILKACCKDKVVHVNRCSERIISLTLMIDGETVNVISAYAPQVGLREGRLVWSYRGGDGGINGCLCRMRVWSEKWSGRVILDFATAHDLVVVNSYFKKRDHHLITFQSGGRCTKIDYLLVQRGDLKACKDCRVFLREACSSQHNLLVLDILFKSVQHRKDGSALPRILWKNLNGDATEAFRCRVAEGVSTQVEVLAASDADSIQAEVRTALQKMERNKVVGPDQIPIEAWRSLGDEGIFWLTSLFNKIFTSAKMPEEWKLNEVIPIFKNKGDAQVYNNYMGIKLLGHTMKLWERVIERRLRREFLMSENQFGFMPRRSSVKAIHLIRSLMKKYMERQRDIHMAFLDVEKAYDSVLGLEKC
ncbi:retrovirus-related pol polyprotein LINE-1 [Tanacetum coccineum]